MAWQTAWVCFVLFSIFPQYLPVLVFVRGRGRVSVEVRRGGRVTEHRVSGVHARLHRLEIFNKKHKERHMLSERISRPRVDSMAAISKYIKYIVLLTNWQHLG